MLVQDKQALVTENQRMLEAATQERDTLMARLSRAEAANELAQGDLRAAVEENDRLSKDVQRAEQAIDALGTEHKRFVDHATELCDRKETELRVRAASCPVLHARCVHCMCCRG